MSNACSLDLRGIVYNPLSEASGPGETGFATGGAFRPHARAATDRPPAHLAKVWEA